MQKMSNQQLQKIAFAKQYIQTKYSLKKQEQQKSRENWIYFENQMQALSLNQATRQLLRAQVKQKQAKYYRQKRVKMTPNDFQTIAVIGRGAFGQVRLCKDIATGQMVAVKRLLKDEMKVKNQVCHIKAQRNILANSNNPWIVQLKYSFQDASSLYLAMQFLQGGDLMNLLIKKLVLSYQQARFYTAQLVLAVQSVHKADYIHRDLKPDNILIDSSGHIKLSDFGLCKHAYIQHQKINTSKPQYILSNLRQINSRDKKTKRQLAYSHVGTPDYIAPQMLFNKGYNQSVDLWSIGVILYQMLIGEAPFCSDSPAETYAKIQNWKQYLYFPQDVFMSKEAKSLILCLICDSDKRFSISQIKAHPFFAGIDWHRLRSTKAPYTPNIKNSTDVSNFDPFTQQQKWGQQQYKRDPQFIGYTFRKKEQFEQLQLMQIVLKKYQRKKQTHESRIDKRAIKPIIGFNQVLQRQKQQSVFQNHFLNKYNANANLNALHLKQNKIQNDQPLQIHKQIFKLQQRGTARIGKESARDTIRQKKHPRQQRQTIRQFKIQKEFLKQAKITQKKDLGKLFKNQSKGSLMNPDKLHYHYEQKKHEGMFYHILKKQNQPPNMQTIQHKNLPSKSGKSPMLKTKPKQQDTKPKIGKIASPNFKALLNSLSQHQTKRK